MVVKLSEALKPTMKLIVSQIQKSRKLTPAARDKLLREAEQRHTIDPNTKGGKITT